MKAENAALASKIQTFPLLVSFLCHSLFGKKKNGGKKKGKVRMAAE